MARAPANPSLIRVDLLAFIMGLTSYAELVGGNVDGASAAVLKSGSRHCVRADIVAVMDDLLEDLKKSFENETSPPGPLISLLFQVVQKRGTAKFLRFGEALPRILNWFQSHLSNFQDILPGSAQSSIQPLIKLGDMTNPQQRLKALGEFSYRSTTRVLRQWVLEEALPSLNLQPQGISAVVADIAATKPYVAEIKSVQQRLSGVDSESEEGAALSEERANLLSDLDTMVGESANPQAVETAVGQALSGEESPLELLQRKYRLDPEQAEVVSYLGEAVVSAVPGSGKTTTMIALIQDSLERGYQPEQILGSTFSKAAQEEFAERLAAKGVTGVQFSTSHSIAMEIILAAAPHLRPQLNPDDADKLFQIAYDQVQMRAPMGGREPDLTEVPIVPDVENKEGSVADHLARVQAAIQKHDPQRVWASILLDFERRLKFRDAKPLTPGQLETVKRFEDTPPGGFRRRRGSDVGFAFTAAPNSSDNKPKTPYRKQPANMWWNLGIEMGRRMTSKGLRTLVGVWQNNGISWQKAWKQHGRLPIPRKEEDGLTEDMAAAAVYAAYVWLKGNDPQYGPVLDFDDYLGKALEMLIRKPKLLATYQNRFKVLVVDEAQDSNTLQWQLFDALGAKTDRYVSVGDPDQAIYGFRGANTELFIERMQKVKLFSIGTNYRSGNTIVDTAQALIKQNEMPVPRVCRAARASGRGMIETRIVPEHEDAATQTADIIEAEIRAGGKPADFGIAVRNNAEMDAFCLALMAKQIPFLCNRDPLSGSAPKVVLAWFTLAIGSGKASRDAINDAVVVAHQNPGFGLNVKFADGLRAAVRNSQDQLQTLLSGVPIYTEPGQGFRNEYVANYADAIRSIQGISKSEELLQAILQVSGINGTIMDRLKRDVDPEDIPEGLEGKELDDAMATIAQIPIKALFGIAKAVPDPAMYLDYITKLRRAKEMAKQQKGKNDSAVRISTSHGWKGLEVQHQFVVMADGVFPNSLSPTEDERKLAYVAVTRGKKAVTVFSPLISYRGPPPARPGVLPPPPKPSMFVGEMETGGCMAVYGKELLGGRGSPMMNPEEELATSAMDSLDDPAEEGDEPIRFARRLMASSDRKDLLEYEPLDSHWKILG